MNENNPAHSTTISPSGPLSRRACRVSFPSSATTVDRVRSSDARICLDSFDQIPRHALFQVGCPDHQGDG